MRNLEYMEDKYIQLPLYKSLTRDLKMLRTARKGILTKRQQVSFLDKSIQLRKMRISLIQAVK